MKTKSLTPKRTADIPAMWRNNADNAELKLFEVATKLSFITESAAFTVHNYTLTEAGITGLALMLAGIQEDVNEIGKELTRLRTGGAQATA